MTRWPKPMSQSRLPACAERQPMRRSILVATVAADVERVANAANESPICRMPRPLDDDCSAPIDNTASNLSHQHVADGPVDALPLISVARTAGGDDGSIRQSVERTP